MGVKADIGVVGLGVMGRNLVLNMAEHGFTVAVFNRTGSVTQEFAAELGRSGSEASSRIQPSCSLEGFVRSMGYAVCWSRGTCSWTGATHSSGTPNTGRPLAEDDEAW